MKTYKITLKSGAINFVECSDESDLIMEIQATLEQGKSLILLDELGKDPTKALYLVAVDQIASIQILPDIGTGDLLKQLQLGDALVEVSGGRDEEADEVLIEQLRETAVKAAEDVSKRDGRRRTS